MFILETASEIFYTSGKTGTRTLLTIPNSKEKDSLKYPISKPITILIREPYQRFVSGLFEINIKSNFHIFSKYSQIHLENNFPNIIPMFYDQNLWLELVNDSMKKVPKLKLGQRLSTIENDFHIGNWLDRANKNRLYWHNHKIVDISDLTDYLNSKNYQFTIQNSIHDFMLSRLISTKIVKSLGLKIDVIKIKAAFKSAVDQCDRIDEIKNYLSNETILYNKLFKEKINFNRSAI